MSDEQPERESVSSVSEDTQPRTSKHKQNDPSIFIPTFSMDEVSTDIPLSPKAKELSIELSGEHSIEINDMTPRFDAVSPSKEARTSTITVEMDEREGEEGEEEEDSFDAVSPMQSPPPSFRPKQV